MSRAELVVELDVAAPAELVWDTVMDWPRQGEWILATRVEVTAGDGRSVGSRVRAATGVGPLAVVDTMVVTEWSEQRPGGPFRCVVEHTGRVVRGDGVFEVVAVDPARSRFRWVENLDLPLGALGRAGWPLVRPAMQAGVAHSMRRMARDCERRARRGASG
ncbi:SRPBCC family protein [Pseudonocardia dioxanivorans]|uniref:SRPBCC family protein n=1 Tax=Pseudonocardia dioxanivorans TaxID=240495 RepID=UPI000CD2A507|nr:SRPBCC family protein [Pseudonocardia dioxanivorans]